MSIDHQPSRARASRFSVPTLAQLFWGPLANRIRRIAEWRKRGVLGKQYADQRRAMHFEPLEPRLLLSADISYTYAAADALKFNDADLLNNHYRLVIEDGAGGGADVMRLLAEDDSELASGILATDGVNKLTLTGDDTVLLGDQLTIDFSSFSGQDAQKYDIQVDMDGKGVIPLTDQDDKVEITGDGGYALNSLTVHAHEDITVTGKVFADDFISLTSSSLDDKGLPGVDGLVFTADSAIAMSNAAAQLQTTTGDISLLSDSTLTIDTSNFSLGAVNIAFALGFSDSAVSISGGTINAGGNLSIEAKSTVNSTLTTVPDEASDDDNTVDAAVASAILSSAPAVTISGGDFDAGGSATIKATNTVTSSAIADGLTGDEGGTVAFNLFLGDTSVDVTGGTIDADSILIQSTSVRTATTTAKATVGGAESGAGTNESEKRLNDPDNSNGGNPDTDQANTGEGNVDFAAAVAVSVVTGDTDASITGGAVHASAGDLDLTASGKATVTTTADGSNKTEASTAVGVGVAINVITPSVNALLGGNADVDGNHINVKALVPESKFEATATSGASGSHVGVAGSLAISVAVVSADATVAGTVEANGADVAVTAESTTRSKAVAKAKVDGGGDATGVGASVAINIADNDTHAELSNNAVLTGANDLTLSAKSDHDMVTEAKGGAAGGTAVTPVVAVSIATYDTRATLGTGSALTVGGDLSVNAEHEIAVNTLADGEAAGSTAAVGAAIAFTYSEDHAVATTLRDVVAMSGAVSFTASSVGQNSTKSKASASGASDTGQDAQGQGDSKRAAGNTRASNSGASGSGTTNQAEAKTSSDSGDGDSISVAAAIAINIVDSEARADIPAGKTVSAGGLLTVRSGSNVDGTAVADGRATEGGSAAVGAAVTVNTVDTKNQASVDGTVSAADGMVVEALMLDRKIGLQTANIQVVDTSNDTIFLGTENGLTTGQKVKYHRDGGSNIGELIDNHDYWVFDAGGGKIKLYDSETNAKAGGTTGLQHLTNSGSGSDHYFTKYIDVPLVGEVENPLDSGKVRFDPDPNQLRVLELGENNGLRTGDEVTYHKATGAPIGNLTDNHLYYVIVLDDTHVQLAASREDALAGKAIKLTSDDVGDDDFLTERTHSIFASATSGAGSDDVGVAGSVAINRAAVVTTARVAGDVALVDGNDGGSAIGPMTVRAHSTSDNTADALPAGAGAVAGSVGVGASFALNLVYNDTTADVQDGADISGSAGSFTVEASGTHRTSTEARNGAKGSTGVGAAVAVAISESDTKAHVGTGAQMNTAGDVSVSSQHTNIVETKVSSEAAGDDAAIGASVGVNYIGDTNNAQIARNVHSTGGSVALDANMTFVSALDVHASAAGGDSGGDDADTEADKKTNNNSNTGGGKTMESAGDNTTSANSQASTESGSQGEEGGGGGVGVAAAIAIDIVRLTNTATVTNGADLTADAGAVTISAQASVDAKSQADGMAVNLSNSSGTSVSAAVALNFVNLTNTATVAGGSTITGNGITIEAVTTADERNDFVATAVAVSGNKSDDPSIAGVFALNVIDVERRPWPPMAPTWNPPGA